MAAEYVRHVREVRPHGPYRLLGWSFGGHVAHAVAEQLQRSGEEVELLALLDAFPPTRRDPAETEETEAEIVGRNLRAIGFAFDADELTEGSFPIERYREFLGHKNKSLAYLDEGQILAVKDVYVNSVRLMRKYTPGHFRGNVLLFSARAPEEARLRRGPNSWKPYTEGEFGNYDIGLLCGRPHSENSRHPSVSAQKPNTYLVLVNEEGQHSLWPSFVEVPAGWEIVVPETDRQTCMDYINENWTDMRPKSLIRAMEGGGRLLDGGRGGVDSP